MGQGGRAAFEGHIMSRVSLFSSPLMLGFDELERILDRANKTAGDGYPPYNIEHLPRQGEGPERWRVVIAVAGFTRDQIDVSIEDNQLVVRGRQKDDDDTRAYLHRGIAARQFNRAFVLADGMTVTEARLDNGLLAIGLERPEPQKLIRRIEIKG
jgi:HSP20 family molecular chaperone IbpA